MYLTNLFFSFLCRAPIHSGVSILFISMSLFSIINNSFGNFCVFYSKNQNMWNGGSNRSENALIHAALTGKMEWFLVFNSDWEKFWFSIK